MREGGKAYFFILIYVLIASLVVWFNTSGPGTDSRRYLRDADRSLAEGTIYPSASRLYSSDVTYPGYVNYLAALRLVGLTYKGILFVNVLLSAALLYTVYACGRRLLPMDETLFFALWLLYPRSYAVNLDCYSELPFTLLAYLAMLLFLHGGVGRASAAGALLAFAGWTRALSVAFLVPLAVWAGARRGNIKEPGAMVCVYFLTFAAFGLLSYLNTGTVVIQSSGGGINLIMGANPDADGEYGQTVFEKGNIGYIADEEALTFKERDRLLKKRALAWMADNPSRYAALFFKKLFITYERDSWGIGKLANVSVEREALGGLSLGKRILWHALQYYNQAVYMAVIALALLSVRRASGLQSAWLLYAVAILFTFFVCLIVGNARYKYPLMPSFLILAASAYWRHWPWAREGGGGGLT